MAQEYSEFDKSRKEPNRRHWDRHTTTINLEMVGVRPCCSYFDIDRMSIFPFFRRNYLDDLVSDLYPLESFES
jgi:hypothetical protein